MRATGIDDPTGERSGAALSPDSTGRRVADPFLQWASLSVQLAAAALMGALAGGLLILNRHSRVVRAFAFVLVIHAGIIVALRLGNASAVGGVLEHPDLARALLAVKLFLRVAYVPAVLLFLLAYIRPSGGGAFRALRWAVAAVLVALELLLLANLTAGDGCLVECSSGGVRRPGPLYPLSEQFGAGTAVAGLAGLAFAISALRRPVGPLHTAVFLLSLAFTLNALFDGGTIVLEVAQRGVAGLVVEGASAPWGWASVVLSVVGFAAALASLAVYGGDARNHPELRRRAAAAYALAAGALATAAFVSARPPPAEGALPDFLSLMAIALVGVWRLALPLLAGLALVKHRLFGIDVRINHGIRRSLVAGSFLAVFFVVTQTVQNLFSSTAYGVVGGGAAAGILLFALHPLQHLGHRVADALVPTSQKKGLRVPREQALEVYRDQALLVWADGFMGRKERALLDHLRDRLGVPVADAVRIEQEAAALGPTAKFPVRKPPRRATRSQAD